MDMLFITVGLSFIGSLGAMLFIGLVIGEAIRKHKERKKY